LRTIADKYGDIVHFKMGRLNYFLLNNPEFIQDVLVNRSDNFVKAPAWRRGKAVLGEGLLTSEGDFHRRQRRLVQPAFHRNRIESFASIMTEVATRVQTDWKDASVVDMAQTMNHVALLVVARTLFGTEIETETTAISKAFGMIRKQWWRTLVLQFVPFSEAIEKLPLATLRQFKEARDRLDETVYKIINQRRKSGDDRGDLLPMLLLAQDEEGDGQGMTDAQVRDEVMTIILAGHETTASSLTWTWYLLSQNPDIEKKFHTELESVLAGRLPTIEDVPKLKYTKMIFTETLRLYPPIWLLIRQALKDYPVKSYVIPANSVIHMCPFVMHRDPRYYSSALLFGRPIRVAGGDSDPRHHWSTLEV
jgi:cytochrome P450